MGPVRLGVGTEWLLDGRAWRVVRQLAPDRFVAQDVKFLVEQEFSQEELLAHYSAGRLRFASDEAQAPQRKPAPAKPTPIQELTGSRNACCMRWQAIEPLTQSGLVPQESDYANRAAELEHDNKCFSARTLRRYFHAWLQAGKDRMALVPRNEGRRRKNGVRKYHWRSTLRFASSSTKPSRPST